MIHFQEKHYGMYNRKLENLNKNEIRKLGFLIELKKMGWPVELKFGTNNEVTSFFRNELKSVL